MEPGPWRWKRQIRTTRPHGSDNLLTIPVLQRQFFSRVEVEIEMQQNENNLNSVPLVYETSALTPELMSQPAGEIF